MSRRNKYRQGEPYRREGQPLKPLGLVKKPVLRAVLSQLCEEAGVVPVRGRHNRKMIHLLDILPLVRYIGESYAPALKLGFDRMSLVLWFTGLEKELEMYGSRGKGKVTANRAGYRRQLELEIHRIGKLEQPAQTIAAVEFLRRLKDARSVTRAAREYLKESYGDLSETRYAGGEQWWKELERLAGIMRPTVGDIAVTPDTDSPVLPPVNDATPDLPGL